MFEEVVYLFFDVVQAGSFSGAAKKNYMSQSAVSQAIAKYEQQLGFELFDRSGYRPKLTKAGEYYYEATKSLVAHHREVLKNATRLSNQTAKLVIGFTNDYEKRQLIEILQRMPQLNPLDVSIKRYRLSEAVSLLRTRQLDLCFGMEIDFSDLRDITCYPVHDGEICVVTSKTHPLAALEEVTVDQLVDEPMIVLSDFIHKDTYTLFMQNFQLDGFVPKISKECDDIDDFFLSVALGEGIGYTVKELVSPQENVHCLLLRGSHHKSTFAIAHRKNEDSEYVLAFTNEIKEFYKTL